MTTASTTTPATDTDPDGGRGRSYRTLKDWDITARLGDIAVPTLVLSGRYDEATPRVVKPITDSIPGARWVLFEDSSHMPHVEEKQRYLDELASFLAGVDRGPLPIRTRPHSPVTHSVHARPIDGCVRSVGATEPRG